MNFDSYEKWIEHKPCVSHEELRIPFEDYMKSTDKNCDLNFNPVGYYEDTVTNLKYIGFCFGAFFMCHYKEHK